jgi:flagellar basal-body rod modification protein FlgD
MATSLISPLSYTQTTNTKTQNAHVSTSSSGSSSSSASTAASSGGVSADEGTFLTLLVSQLKNQDPLSPTDSTQFVSELAQFSQLEQMININQNVSTITNTVSGAGSASTTSNALTGGTGGSSVPGSVTTTDYNTLLNGVG